MIRYRAELSIARAFAVFAAGVVGGVQIALYLFDLYDDGVADVRSAWIGVALLVLGAGFVLWSFRRAVKDRIAPKESAR